jgi:UDP-GlcNAc:undecaprenyl-phosphate GlcNAc-1-phosphate transferase
MAAGLSLAQWLGVPSVVSAGLPLYAPLILAAACGGFLIVNFKPARIFMGDAGSMFIGFTLSAMALAAAFIGKPGGHSVNGSPLVAYIFVILLFGLPICDGGLVTVARIANRRVLTAGAKDHLSHRLVALGLSERGAVVTLYGAAALFAGCALLYGATQSLFVPLAALVAVLPGLVKLYRATVYETAEARGRAEPRAAD